MAHQQKPTLANSILESRVALEMGGGKISKPALSRLLPAGDGHPVLVIPAFLAPNGLTAEMRDFLEGLGYDVRPWDVGINWGVRSDFLGALRQQFEAIYAETGKKISIIGWSLGGLYTRALANLYPEQTRQAITMGSPFYIPDLEMHGINTVIGKMYHALNPIQDQIIDEAETLWQPSPDVPCTSIFTKGDGIVQWRYCVDHDSPTTQSLRIPGSHVGLTHNPLAWYLVGHRLAQTEDNWQRFDNRHGALKFLYRSLCRSELDELAENQAQQLASATNGF